MGTSNDEDTSTHRIDDGSVIHWRRGPVATPAERRSDNIRRLCVMRKSMSVLGVSLVLACLAIVAFMILLSSYSIVGVVRGPDGLGNGLVGLCDRSPPRRRRLGLCAAGLRPLHGRSLESSPGRAAGAGRCWQLHRPCADDRPE